MPDYSFSQSEARHHSHFCIRCIVCSGPVVIDSADTDIYVAAAAISQKLPGLLCIKRKQATILYATTLCLRKWQTALYHYIASLAGCDANSSRVNSLDIEEEAIEELFELTRLVVCGDKVSRNSSSCEVEGNEEEIVHSPPMCTRWIACVNIAFVPTTWLIWCITPP